MPASLLTEILFRGAFEILFYGLGYVIGWLVVPIVSFGYYSVEPWDRESSPQSKTLGQPEPAERPVLEALRRRLQAQPALHVARRAKWFVRGRVFHSTRQDQMSLPERRVPGNRASVDLPMRRKHSTQG